MNYMKICVLAPYDVGYDGGPNVVIRNLIREWSKFHSVTLVTISNGSFSSNSVARVTLGGGRYFTWLIRSFGNLPNIVNHDVIVDEGLTFPILQCARMNKRTQSFLHFHGVPKANLWNEHLSVSEFRNHCERLISMVAAKSIIAGSQLHRRAILASFGGFLTHKIHVIGHGVDLELFQRTKPGGHQILFVGNIGEGDLFVRKDVRTLLSALSMISREIPDVSLVMVGTVGNNIERVCREFGVSSRVRWLGHLRQSELAKLFGESRVLVLPSTFDAYGQAVNEAMASGIPVVVSDRVGASEIVRTANCGFVFPTGNARRLRDCLKAVLDSDGLASELGENGWSYAHKHLAWGLVAQRYIELFRTAAV